MLFGRACWCNLLTLECRTATRQQGGGKAGNRPYELFTVIRVGHINVTSFFDPRVRHQGVCEL